MVLVPDSATDCVTLGSSREEKSVVYKPILGLITKCCLIFMQFESFLQRNFKSLVSETSAFLLENWIISRLKLAPLGMTKDPVFEVL